MLRFLMIVFYMKKFLQSSIFNLQSSMFGRQRLIWIWFTILSIVVLFSITPSPCSAQSKAIPLPIDPPVVSRVIVYIIDPPPYQKDWTTLARTLIHVQNGDRFSSQNVLKSITALEKSELFESIFADTRKAGDAIEIIFRLTPFAIIKDIHIQGSYPLFEEEIIKMLGISVGDAYIADAMPRQTERIQALYRREGLINPQVTVSGRRDPKDGYIVVHIQIERQGRFVLETIRFSGNRSFSESRLRNQMDVWQPVMKQTYSGRFREQVFKEDLKNLTRFYREKGFAEIDLKPEVNKDPKTGKVTVHIHVEEGPLYRIQFKGRTAFWKQTLRQDVAIFKEGNKNNRGLSKTVRQIKERYRASGFLETRVKWEAEQVTQNSRNEKQVAIIIEEGPQTIVETINMVGNRRFGQKELKKEIQTAPPGTLHKGYFVPEILAVDILKLKTLYLKQGYAKTAIKEEVTYPDDKTHAAVTLKIDEGARTLVTGLKLDGISAVKIEDALNVLKLKPGSPYRPYMLKSDESALSALISESGYPHVVVKGKADISRDGTSAEVAYQVIESIHVKMGNTFFAGNFRTRQSLLEKEINLKSGEPFSLKKMLEGQRNLRNMDSLKSVRFKPIGLKEKRDRVDLIVEVEEKKPYFFELGGGYQSDKHLFAQARLGDRNLFGFNKSAYMGGEISEIGYRIGMGGTDPRFLGTRISAFTGLYLEESEEFNLTFGTRSYGGAVGATTPKWHHLIFKTDFNYERREQFQHEDVQIEKPPEEDEFEPRNILELTSTGIYDLRDSFVRPRKGLYSSLSVDFSNGLDNDLDDFFRYRYGLRYYYTPWHRLTLAMIGRAGFIDPYGNSKKVPEDQLFFLGGISDVRGFDENLLMYDDQGNPVGGRGALSASLEMRLDMGSHIELTFFYDVGKILEPEGESVAENERASIGVGLRYHTPVGPIGFLYGFKLNPREEESPGRFHFSIGYTF